MERTPVRLSQKLFDAWLDEMEASDRIHDVARRVPKETRRLMKLWALECRIRAYREDVDRDEFFAEMKEALRG